MITGLDIGTAFIKGIVAEEKKDGSLSVVTAFKHPSAGVRKGVLVDAEEVAAVLRELVLDLQKISKKAVQNVFVSFQSEHVKSHLSQGMVAVARADQEIHEDDIVRVKETAGSVKLPSNFMALHNIVREFFVDDIGDISDPVGMIGNRLGVSTLIVQAFVPHYTQLLRTLERVGVRIGGIIYDPIAAGRAVISKKLRELGVMMVHMGAGATSVLVYEEGKTLLTKTIPIGSAYVTNDIAIGLKTSIDVAEKLKVTYGCALARAIGKREMIDFTEMDASVRGDISRKLLAEIIEIRLAEILDLVDNELKSVGRSVQLPGGIVLTGGGVKLPGMAELVKSEMKLPVQIGFPLLSGMEIPSPTYAEMLDDPEFATAVGLVFLGTEENESVKSSNHFGAALKKMIKNFIP
ncbi:MAG: cell division protein FtsA [Patescibacteria group bacterium]